ncbi:unnamed protein product [Cyclocybe aegerita]|uniref:Uncharacterized protein n=1 Tax=Cyclocybe aegerita TaxID=1973307 RepID=A0A8S0W6Y8_CYCAE|nr:unnamed protein product [Cyclocybe aegerita]
MFLDFCAAIQVFGKRIEGTKRAAADDTSETATKSKVARTEKNGNGAKNKKAAVKVPTTDEFKAKALPLHVHLTHTPPSIQKEGAVDSEGKEEAPPPSDASAEDVGFIGNVTLVPSTFSTGSYGWKGSKRITVELQGGEADAEGGKEKVTIMLSINATVVGSKPAKGAKGKKGKKNQDEEADEEEAEEDPEE